MNDLRGTGRTKDLMVRAPKGAVFIWKDDNLRYVLRMRKWLDREDIQLYGPSILESPVLRGRKISAIILDHTVKLTTEQQQMLDGLLKDNFRWFTPLPLQAAWSESLLAFMSAYEIAAESAMGVPEEILRIAPLAAKYLDSQGMCGSRVCRALLVEPSKVR